MSRDAANGRNEFQKRESGGGTGRPSGENSPRRPPRPTIDGEATGRSTRRPPRPLRRRRLQEDTNSNPNSEPMQQKDFNLLQLGPIQDFIHQRREYFRLLSLAKKKATIPASSICATGPNTSSSLPPATSGLLQSRCNSGRTRFLHASHNKLHKTAATSPGVLPSRFNTQHKRSPTHSASSNM
ncbi:hypothetical protein Nepgr_006730 [Nepenthes gracilis]|uniref:Uncharacterized protein n=1 Tax=Nepenthes gracilis TaxID=150966 RepID=A0AAD3XHQ3_NEPGR|nr:hypothetical protein Nepgr_006730 [Nepenthes gracilis]